MHYWEALAICWPLALVCSLLLTGDKRRQLEIPAFLLPSTAVHTINNGTNFNNMHGSPTFAILKAMHWFVMRPLVVTSQDAIVCTPSCDKMVASTGVWASLMNTKHLSAHGVKTNNYRME